jgi:hypothetical protein
VLAALIVAGAAFLPGCAAKGRKPVYPAHGRVLDADNKPAAGALVILHPVAPGGTDAAKPLGYVGEDGSFALTTYVKDDGAPEGDYVATVEWQPPPANPFAGRKQATDRLKGKYSDPKTSPFRFKIEKQEDNDLPPIILR